LAGWLDEVWDTFGVLWWSELVSLESSEVQLHRSSLLSRHVLSCIWGGIIH
jgi:hypothetical protein